MPYTFGGATGDDITFGPGMSAGANNGSLVVYGWWMPTTLTATRGLWSMGNTIGAEIDSTTDELRLRSDNTTDGEWTTTGVDLAVNNWKFLAFFATFSNTGPAVDWRVWAGDINLPPVACTVASAVAPVGNNTGNGNFYVGNKGSGSLAFQGDIAHVGCMIGDGSGTGVTTHPFYLSAHGAISAEAEQLVLEHFVWPCYRGDYRVPSLVGSQRGNIGGTNQRASWWHMALDIGAYVVGGGGVPTSTFPPVSSVNGPVPAATDSPRPLMGPATLPFVRR